MNTRLLATALAAVLMVSAPAFAASTMSSGAAMSGSATTPAGSTKAMASTTTTKPAAKAHFYIAQSAGAKGCSIVSTRPDGKTMTMVGKYYYNSKTTAQVAAKHMAACKA